MGTWTLKVDAQAITSGKNMMAISNATGSGRVIRIYRMWVTNPQTSNVTGGITLFKLGRVSSGIHSGGTAITWVPHSSAVTAGSATPFTGITAVHGGSAITATFGTLLLRFARSNDELAAGGATLDEMCNVLPWALMFDAGVGDSNVEPIVIRENSSVLLRMDTVGFYVGSCDIMVELTVETT